VVGVLAAAAVLLPALVAIIVMSGRSKGAESGAASTSTAVSVPLPATAQTAVVVPVVTATAPPAVTATATASDTAPAASAPAPPATEEPVASKKAVTGGSGGGGTSVSKPVVTADPPPAKTVKPVDPPASGGATGTLMAVALGGSCAFSVNGSSKGSGSSMKVTLPPGTYSVMCKPAGGAIKSKSITVKSGATAMATFKL
jgi:serine/threonine-protein kinase